MYLKFRSLSAAVSCLIQCTWMMCSCIFVQWTLLLL